MRISALQTLPEMTVHIEKHDALSQNLWRKMTNIPSPWSEKPRTCEWFQTFGCWTPTSPRSLWTSCSVLVCRQLQAQRWNSIICAASPWMSVFTDSIDTHSTWMRMLMFDTSSKEGKLCDAVEQPFRLLEVRSELIYEARWQLINEMSLELYRVYVDIYFLGLFALM